MDDNVRFIERPQEFEAQRFNADNPLAIIEWVRSKRSGAVVVFEFPTKAMLELDPNAEAGRYLAVDHYRTEECECALVGEGYWLIYNWPVGKNNHKWVVMNEEQFNLTFKEAD